jgi:zinc protease
MHLTEGVARHILDNGLTVLIKERHTAPVVAIHTYVKAGYFNEADNVAGISHLIEHMFFKGTERRGVGEISNETKALGGFLNASTIYDHTLYYTVLPSENFALGIDIQADALMNSIFDPDELQRETEVVIQEAKRKLDAPAAVAKEKLFELAFEKHRIRRWRIGTEAGLRALTRDDFLTFYGEHYRPENIILSVVGDIHQEETLAVIKEQYGHFSRGLLKKESSPPEPPQKDFRYGRMHGDIQKSHLSFLFHLPKLFHPDTYAADILAFILGHGRSSRLVQGVKEKKQLVNTISASTYMLEDFGTFMIDATTSPDKTESAAAAIMEEIGRLGREVVDEEELDRARNILEAISLLSLESASGMAGLLARYEAVGGYKLVDEYLDKVCRVTKEETLAVARKYLTISNCSLHEYSPTGTEGTQRKSEEIRQSLAAAMVNGGSSYKGEFPEPLKKQILISPGEKNGGGFETEILSNGCQLHIKENSDVPIVAVGIYTAGSRSLETDGTAGIGALHSRLPLKGTAHRSSSRLAYEIERLGTAIGFSNEPDYIACSMAFLSKHIHPALELLSDVLLNPAFDEEELQKERYQAISAVQKLKDDMFRYPLKLFFRGLFGEHGYGMSSLGEEEILEQISREEIAEWHHRHFARQSPGIYIVGDVDRKGIAALLEEKLAAFSQNNHTEHEYRNVEFPHETTVIAEAQKKEQTALVIGFPGPAFTDPDYYPMVILQNIVSGLGGRFFEELRGRQSLAYTVSSFLVARKLAGAFLSYIATSPDKEEQARDGLLAEYEKVRKTGVTDEELHQSVQYTVGMHKIGQESYGAQMALFAHNDMMGRSQADFESYSRRIHAVTRDEVQAVARKYFNPDCYVEGIVRGNSSWT